MQRERSKTSIRCNTTRAHTTTSYNCKPKISPCHFKLYLLLLFPPHRKQRRLLFHKIALLCKNIDGNPTPKQKSQRLLFVHFTFHSASTEPMIDRKSKKNAIDSHPDDDETNLSSQLDKGFKTRCRRRVIAHMIRFEGPCETACAAHQYQFTVAPQLWITYRYGINGLKIIK